MRARCRKSEKTINNHGTKERGFLVRKNHLFSQNNWLTISPENYDVVLPRKLSEDAKCLPILNLIIGKSRLLYQFRRTSTSNYDNHNGVSV